MGLFLHITDSEWIDLQEKSWEAGGGGRGKTRKAPRPLGGCFTSSGAAVILPTAVTAEVFTPLLLKLQCRVRPGEEQSL